MRISKEEARQIARGDRRDIEKIIVALAEHLEQVERENSRLIADWDSRMLSAHCDACGAPCEDCGVGVVLCGECEEKMRGEDPSIYAESDVWAWIMAERATRGEVLA
jgi:hypothetical protein